MKKIKQFWIFLLLIIPCLFVLASCEVVTTGAGKSAYDIACENGFVGTEAEWLESLKGDSGSNLNIMDIYASAQENGYSGTFLEFLEKYFKETSIDGKSAYDIACENGYTGTEAEWLESLKGETGMAGSDGATGDTIDLYKVYQQLVELGEIKCSYLEFVQEYLNVKVETSNEEAIGKAIQSSVTILCTKYSKDSWTTASASGQAGSGVIYKLNKAAGDAYIITNFHVVYDSDNTKAVLPYSYVYLYGQEYADSAIPATYVGGSATYDIAVLKVTNSEVLKKSDCFAVTPMDSNQVYVGSTAIAIGNPEGKGFSVTEGIVCVDSESIDMTPSRTEGVSLDNTGKISMRVMRIDTPVNSGNSGGGLYNNKGELIGIVNAKIKDSSIENIGYAIPSNVAISVAQNIIDNCSNSQTSPVKCLMGVTIAPASSKAYYDAVTGLTKIIETVEVQDVSSTGIASGKLQAGDILKSFTLRGVTYEVNRNYVMVDACLNARQGDVGTLVVERNGETITVELTFGAGVIVG